MSAPGTVEGSLLIPGDLKSVHVLSAFWTWKEVLSALQHQVLRDPNGLQPRWGPIIPIPRNRNELLAVKAVPSQRLEQKSSTAITGGLELALRVLAGEGDLATSKPIKCTNEEKNEDDRGSHRLNSLIERASNPWMRAGLRWFASFAGAVDLYPGLMVTGSSLYRQGGWLSRIVLICYPLSDCTG